MNPKMGRPPYPKVRLAATVPGILMTVLPERWREFYYPDFSPYGLELVCHDLRNRRTHSLTAPIAHQDAQLQEAVDREVIRHYKPGSKERNGALIQFMLGMRTAPCREPDRGDFKKSMVRLRIPIKISECIGERVEELGYLGFSAYLTGLIRFDLMLGGPHKHYTGLDMDEKLLRELDEMTVKTFRSKTLKPTFIDYELERIEGRKMTHEEREQEFARLAEGFVGHAAKRTSRKPALQP